MITKYFVDGSGNYLGGFCGALPPDGSIEVPSPPNNGLDKWIDGAWVQNKNAVWEKIKAERDRRTQTGGYKVGNYWFHSDQTSRIQQLGLVISGQNIPQGLMWKTMSGEFVVMTPTLAQQVFAAAALSDTATFQAAEAHRIAMEASNDPASYDFSTGWPAIYGE